MRKPSEGRDPKPVKDRLKESRESLKAIKDRQAAGKDGKK